MFAYIITIKIEKKALTQISAFSTYAFVVFTTSFIMTYRSSVTKESYESSIDSSMASNIESTSYLSMSLNPSVILISSLNTSG